MALVSAGAGLAIMAFDVATLLQGLLGNQKVDPRTQTQITIIVGDAPNGGGSVPDIHVKGPYGFRLAYESDDSRHKNDHLRGNEGRTFVIDNLPGIDLKPQVHQPQYVSLVARGSDAICVSAIIASGNSATYTWTGDMGQYCGAEWYASKFSFGQSSVPPKCVWLDADHTNGVVASAISLHMTDFSGGLLSQYQETNDKGENIGYARLCKNSARMTFHPTWTYQNFEVFDKLLDVNEKGELVEPDLGIDRQERAYPDGTHLPWIKNRKLKRYHSRDLSKRHNSNPYPKHLTISHIPSHSARMLCESDTSRGADFVAINDYETLFCDMTKKRLVDVCDEIHIRACFDLEKKEMRDVGAQLQRRDMLYGDIVPTKRYETHEEWK